MKKLYAAAGAIWLLLSACFSLTSCDAIEKGELWMDSFTVEATLDAQGNLAVSETWTVGVNSSEGYRNFYKTFSLYDRQFGTSGKIVNMSVYDNDNQTSLTELKPSGSISDYLNRANTWYIQRSGNDYELGVIVPSVKSGTRSFTFAYTLKDAAGMYGDTAVLYWQQISGENELLIEEYSCVIKLPDGASTQGTRAWFHTEAESKVEIREDGLYYTASDISRQTQIETRLTMPKELFGTLTKTSDEPKLDAIIAEEEAWADAWEAEQRAEYRKAVANTVIAAAVVAVAIGLVVFLRVKNRRGKEDYPKYFRDIPKEWSAGELGHLFYYYEGGVEKKNLRGRLLSATILELARRHYIEIMPTADNDYKIHVKDVSDAMKGDLRPYEHTLYRLLERVENWAKHEFTMDEFEKYAKKHYSDIDNAINEFNTKSIDWFRKSGFVGNLSRLNGILTRAGVALGIIGVILFMYGGAAFLPLGMVLAGITLYAGTPKLANLNKKGEEEYARAHGLKNYMLDFSNLKEYDIPQLILWEEYLVYATMMNISKEVIKNLKLVYPEISKQTEDGRGYYYNPTGSYLFTYLWLSRVMRGDLGGGFDLGAHMERSITSIRNTAYQLQHPSNKGGLGGSGFGGGGFRGGGGGFGGGSFGGRH